MRFQKHLPYSNIKTDFISCRVHSFTYAILEKCTVLGNCIGFADKTLTRYAILGECAEQNATYNWHKYKDTLRFKTATCSDEVILQVQESMKNSKIGYYTSKAT